MFDSFKSRNHALSLFPRFSKDEKGITANEFLSKLNEEFIGTYSVSMADQLINSLFNDGKIEKITSGGRLIRLRQVNGMSFYPIHADHTDS